MSDNYEESLRSCLSTFSYKKKSNFLATSYTKVKDFFSDKEQISVFEIICEKNWGYTVAHPLRRILLSKIPGSAVVAISINNVKHEFDTIRGVRETVPEIVLKLKKLSICINEAKENIYFINATKTGGVLSGKDFECPDNVTITNPDIVICNISENIEISFKLAVGSFEGYLTSKDHSFSPMLPENFFPVDSIFSPVTFCDYEVEECTGGKDEFDKITMKISTNCHITPEESLKNSVDLLIKHIQSIRGVEEEDISPTSTQEESLSNLEETYISQVGFNTRAINCLHNRNIMTVRDLIESSHEEVASIPGMGTKSMESIVKFLSENNLKFSSKINRRIR